MPPAKYLVRKSPINGVIDEKLLSENASMPPADVAVRIANALEVSVEYLVTGYEKSKNNKPEKNKIVHLSPEIHNMAIIMESLNPEHRKTVSAVIKTLKKLEEPQPI